MTSICIPPSTVIYIRGASSYLSIVYRVSEVTSAQNSGLYRVCYPVNKRSRKCVNHEMLKEKLKVSCVCMSKIEQTSLVSGVYLGAS